MYLTTIIAYVCTLVIVKANKTVNPSKNLCDDKLQQIENLVHILVQSNELSAKLANCNDELLKKEDYIFERNKIYVDKLTMYEDELLQNERNCHSKIYDLKLKENQHLIEALNSKYISKENNVLKEEVKTIKSDLQASEKFTSLLLAENERLRKEIQNLTMISQTEIPDKLDDKKYTTKKIKTIILEKNTDIDNNGTVISKTTNNFNAEKTTNHTIKCPNGRSRNNSRALLKATRHDNIKEVNRLLQACEDPDGIFISYEENHLNDSSLLAACKSNIRQVAKILIEFDADVNYVNSEGDTALHGAVILGGIEIIKMLLAHGARINHVNQWNQNAIYCSIDSAPVETIKLLIDAGGDVNVKTTDGKTPLSAAKSLLMNNRKIEIISLLKAAKATE